MTLEAAEDDGIAQTIAVMGGKAWECWLHALIEAAVFAKEDIETLQQAPDITSARFGWRVFGSKRRFGEFLDFRRFLQK